jgi:hypothetical protein
MIAEAEHLVCTNPECREEIVVGRRPALKKQTLRCAWGGELKKQYHPPVLTVYGTVFRECPTRC